MANDGLRSWLLKRPGDKSSNDLRTVAFPLLRFQNAVSNLDEPAFRAAFEACDADQNSRIPANAEPQVPSHHRPALPSAARPGNGAGYFHRLRAGANLGVVGLRATAQRLADRSSPLAPARLCRAQARGEMSGDEAG